MSLGVIKMYAAEIQQMLEQENTNSKLSISTRGKIL